MFEDFHLERVAGLPLVVWPKLRLWNTNSIEARCGQPVTADKPFRLSVKPADAFNDPFVPLHVAGDPVVNARMTIVDSDALTGLKARLG